MDRLNYTAPSDTDVRIGQLANVRVGGGDPVSATVIAAELIDDGIRITVGMDRMPAFSSSDRLDVDLGATVSS